MKSILIPISSPIHKPELVYKTLRKYQELLGDVVTEITGIVTRPEELDSIPTNGVDAYIVAVITGGTEELVLELGRRDIPLALVAHESQNSLAASLEALSKLRYESKPVVLMLLRKNIKTQVESFVRASYTYKRLIGSKILLIGDPSPWLIYSNEQLDIIKKFLNINFIKLGIDELINIMNSVDSKEVTELMSKFEGIESIGITTESLKKSLRLYLAIKALLHRYNTRYLTIRCFDLLRYDLTACLPLSMLNDEGYVATCEGDVPALITAISLSLISGRPVFMGNIDWVEGSDVLIAHCTSPTSILGKYRLRTHFESGIGVAIEGYLSRGMKVTIARFDFIRKLIRVSKGVVVNEAPVSSELCRTQMLIRIFGNPSKLIEDPIGNHYVLAFGDYSLPLRYLALMLDMVFELA